MNRLDPEYMEQVEAACQREPFLAQHLSAVVDEWDSTFRGLEETTKTLLAQRRDLYSILEAVSDAWAGWDVGDVAGWEAMVDAMRRVRESLADAGLQDAATQ